MLLFWHTPSLFLSTTSAFSKSGDGRGDEVREDTNGRLKCNEEPHSLSLPVFFLAQFDVSTGALLDLISPSHFYHSNQPTQTDWLSKRYYSVLKLSNEVSNRRKSSARTDDDFSSRPVNYLLIYNWTRQKIKRGESRVRSIPNTAQRQ